jgi:FHA domain
MIPYKCISPDCPLPDEVYAAKLRRPPACSLGHCRIEAASFEPRHASDVAPPTDAELPSREPKGTDEPIVDPRPAVFDFVDAAETARTSRIAALIVGGARFELPSVCVLGREGDAASEAFGGDRTVSRRHARLTIEPGAAYLENVSERGNTLVVNGTTLTTGVLSKLNVGRNRVRFGARFACEIELAP